MSHIDTSAYRTSFLFFPNDEKSLARYIGLDRDTICHPERICESFIAFLDTPNRDFEKNKTDVVQFNHNSEFGINFNGVDKHAYDTDNIWNTQARRLIGWDSSVNGTKWIQDPGLENTLGMQGTPIKIRHGEWGVDHDKTDIGIYWENWPEIDLTHVRFYSPQPGSMSNGRYVIDAYTDKSVGDPKQVENHYNRQNYLKMMLFVDNLFDKGLITPVTQPPSVMAQKISRFG